MERQGSWVGREMGGGDQGMLRVGFLEANEKAGVVAAAGHLPLSLNPQTTTPTRKNPKHHRHKLSFSGLQAGGKGKQNRLIYVELIIMLENKSVKEIIYQSYFDKITEKPKWMGDPHLLDRGCGADL